jgi:FtsP/CotA-like multicopper oxidase with cupredoxin domain
LRILNGSNSRIYTLGRDDGADLLIVGSDGSLLERPVRQRRLRLGPGERAELLVDMQASRTVRLMSYPDAAAARGMGGGMTMGGMAGNNETFPIVELRAGRLESADLSVPERLIRVPGWTAAQAARTRTFTLDMAMMGMMSGMGGMGGRGMGGAMGINGRAMSMERIDERVPLGSIEIWEIQNASPLTHPFHVHDIQFRVLDRDGAPPLPHEAGLKDTVLVDPASAVRVIAEFADFADPQHPYMYHCHILEHEDAGMMGQFVVV